MEQVFLADTSRHTMVSACYNIYLRPAVVLQNTLPVDIIVSPQGIQKPLEQIVKPGSTLHLPQVQPGDTSIVIMVIIVLYLNFSLLNCCNSFNYMIKLYDLVTFILGKMLGLHKRNSRKCPRICSLVF